MLAKLDVLQAKALRVCSGAFRTTPIAALQVELGETPLELRRMKLVLHYWVKLKANGLNAPTKCLIEQHWELTDATKKTSFVNSKSI